MAARRAARAWRAVAVDRRCSAERVPRIRAGRMRDLPSLLAASGRLTSGKGHSRTHRSDDCSPSAMPPAATNAACMHPLDQGIGLQPRPHGMWPSIHERGASPARARGSTTRAPVRAARVAGLVDRAFSASSRHPAS